MPPLKLEGAHVALVPQMDIDTALSAAHTVFAQNQADPLACAAAFEKLEKDEPLTRDEALLCVIWDNADDKAFRVATLGWLMRDVDIRLAIDPAS